MSFIRLTNHGICTIIRVDKLYFLHHQGRDMAEYKAPWEFYPELTEERLSIIAEELLRVLAHTSEQLSTPLDDNYTKGTCTFGRQRQLLIKLCMSDKYDWLS